MQKIMFNERFGLQQATFDGTKTMTRRTVPDNIMKDALAYQSHHIDDEKAYEKYILDHAPYKVGEIVAIAQRYKDVALHIYNKKIVRLDKEDGTEPKPLDMIDTLLYLQSLKGFDNKMYVKAEWMPHHIKTTGIKVESLACISDEDCLKEGITHVPVGINHFGFRDLVKGVAYYFYTPYQAYKYLIDSLNKRGFFESNPIVFVYTYELID